MGDGLKHSKIPSRQPLNVFFNNESTFDVHSEKINLISTGSIETSNMIVKYDNVAYEWNSNVYSSIFDQNEFSNIGNDVILKSIPYSKLLDKENTSIDNIVNIQEPVVAPIYLIWDFTNVNNTTEWIAKAGTIPDFTYSANWIMKDDYPNTIFNYPNTSDGFIQFTIPIGYDSVVVNYGAQDNTVYLAINNVVVDQVTGGVNVLTLKTYTKIGGLVAGQKIKIYEIAGGVMARTKVTFSNTIQPEVIPNTDYKYLAFNCGDTASNFAITDKTFQIFFSESITCDVFMIAGGGAGGGPLGGGGGAGGYYLSTEQGNNPITFLENQTYTVIIGRGGIPGPSDTDGPITGANGNDTVIKNSVGIDILRVKGGGQGGIDYYGGDPLGNAPIPIVGSNGGCGGGGAGYNDTSGTGNNPRTAAGGSAVNVNGKGFAGGSGIHYKNHTNGTRYMTGGGGGGIGGLGENAFNTEFEAGDGGAALAINLTGTPAVYGGGGGGGAFSTSTTRAVGGGAFVTDAIVRVGGLGETYDISGLSPRCAANTGSGGGGAGNNGNDIEDTSGSGGVVIIRYKLTSGSTITGKTPGILKYLPTTTNPPSNTGSWAIQEADTVTFKSDFVYTLQKLTSTPNGNNYTTDFLFDPDTKFTPKENWGKNYTYNICASVNSTYTVDNKKYCFVFVYFNNKSGTPTFNHKIISSNDESDWIISDYTDSTNKRYVKITVQTTNPIQYLNIKI